MPGCERARTVTSNRASTRWNHVERRTCVLPPTEREREQSRSFDGTPSPLTDYSREPLDPSSLFLCHPSTVTREDLATRLTRGFLLPTCLSLYLRTSWPRVLPSYDKYIYIRFQRYIDRSRSFAIILTFALPSCAPLSERRNVINKFSRWTAQRTEKTEEREEKDAATSSPIPSRLYYIARTNLIATDIKYYRRTKDDERSWPSFAKILQGRGTLLGPPSLSNRSTFDSNSAV